MKTVRDIFWKEIKARGKLWAVEGWLGVDGSPKCSIYEGKRNAFGTMTWRGVPLTELEKVPANVRKANVTAMKKAELASGNRDSSR